MALIPKGGKLQQRGAVVKRALGAEGGIGYKCSAITSVS